VGFQLDLKVGEGLWAKRGKDNPIKDRQHQLNSVEYIADHGDRGAVVYLHANADRWLRERKKQRAKESPRRRRGSGGQPRSVRPAATSEATRTKEAGGCEAGYGGGRGLRN